MSRCGWDPFIQRFFAYIHLRIRSGNSTNQKSVVILQSTAYCNFNTILTRNIRLFAGHSYVFDSTAVTFKESKVFVVPQGLPHPMQCCSGQVLQYLHRSRHGVFQRSFLSVVQKFIQHCEVSLMSILGDTLLWIAVNLDLIL